MTQPILTSVTVSQADNLAQYEPGTVVTFPPYGTIQYVRTMTPVTAGETFAVEFPFFVITPSNIGTHRAPNDVPANSYFWASVLDHATAGSVTDTLAITYAIIFG